MKCVVTYQLGPLDPCFHLFTVCYCTFTKIHSGREIHCFLNLSPDLGEKETFWMLLRIISSFIFTWIWFSFDGCITSVSPRGVRCILQQKPAEDSFIYLQKKASVIQMKHLVNPGGRWETGPTFHFGSSANPSGSVVTGCGFLFTVIPSLCWRHWTREGGSPADMRGVTKLKSEEKKTKANLFLVRSRGWSRCQVHEWPENLRQPAEPLAVRSEDETTVEPSSSRRSQSQGILHTLLSDKLRIWSSGSGKQDPESGQSPCQLHTSSNKKQIYCRGTTKRPTIAWGCSTFESLLTRSSGFLSSKTGWRQKRMNSFDWLWNKATMESLPYSHSSMKDLKLPLSSK